jgi:hypothetical protein
MRSGTFFACVAAFCGMLSAQTLARVDFRRDAQPTLKSNCHGRRGSLMNNFRLDRRRALAGQPLFADWPEEHRDAKAPPLAAERPTRDH